MVNPQAATPQQSHNSDTYRFRTPHCSCCCCWLPQSAGICPAKCTKKINDELFWCCCCCQQQSLSLSRILRRSIYTHLIIITAAVVAVVVVVTTAATSVVIVVFIIVHFWYWVIVPWPWVAITFVALNAFHWLWVFAADLLAVLSCVCVCVRHVACYERFIEVLLSKRGECDGKW